MANQQILWSRNQIIKKMNISGFIWDQLCFLNGNIPISNRKIKKKNSKIYFSKKKVKKFQNDPFLKQIRYIKSWKKTLHKSQKENSLYFKKKKSRFYPSYSFERLIKKRFPDFLSTFSTIDQIFVLTWLKDYIFKDISMADRLSFDKANFFKIFFFIKNMGNLNCLYITEHCYHIELNSLGSVIRFIFPRKSYLPKKIKKKNKLFSSFFELNMSLLKLIITKLYKINREKADKYFITDKQSTFLEFFCVKKKIYKNIKKKKEKFLLFCFSKSLRFMLKMYVSTNSSEKSLFGNKNFTFSKNFDFFIEKNYLSGYVFFIQDLFYNEFFLILNLFLEIKNTKKKNDNNMFGFLFKNNSLSTSIISLKVSLTWLTSVLNTKTIFPIKFVKQAEFFLIKFNPFFLKFIKKKKFSPFLFRKKFQIQKILEQEKNSLKKKNIFLLKFIEKSKIKISNIQMGMRCVNKTF